MTREETDLAAVQWFIEKRGVHAEAFVAGQIGALAPRCDAAAIARRQAIAVEVQVLRTRSER